MHMHDGAFGSLRDACRPDAAAHRRGAASQGRASGQRHRRGDGHPSVGRVAPPAHPERSGVRAGAARRAAPAVLAAARAVPGARSVDHRLPRTLGRPARSARRRDRAQSEEERQRMTRQRITLERTYKTSLPELWDLWTTKHGIESWWGPEGFRVEVERID